MPRDELLMSRAVPSRLRENTRAYSVLINIDSVHCLFTTGVHGGRVQSVTAIGALWILDLGSLMA